MPKDYLFYYVKDCGIWYSDFYWRRMGLPMRSPISISFVGRESHPLNHWLGMFYDAGHFLYDGQTIRDEIPSIVISAEPWIDLQEIVDRIQDSQSGTSTAELLFFTEEE